MLTGRARLAGIVGWPVAHSASPRLHGYWLDHYGIDGAYVPLPVRPEDLESALRALPQLGFAGVNVTVPHKEAALAIVDGVAPLAARIGAVNTITVKGDGSLWGENTDGSGFIANLAERVPGWQASTGPAVILGAGGAARAVGAALLDAGAPELRILNRTEGRARALAETLGERAQPAPLDDAGALGGAALLVNTTTLGMRGQPGLDLDVAALPRAAVVSDIVYVPLRTPLLATAQARGHRVADGLGMLLHQARPGFAAWFGVTPRVTERLRAVVAGETGR
jgi:shikimate dehydrogenase